MSCVCLLFLLVLRLRLAGTFIERQNGLVFSADVLGATWDLSQSSDMTSDLNYDGDDPSGVAGDYPSWGSAEDPSRWSAPFPVNGTVFEVKLM